MSRTRTRYLGNGKDNSTVRFMVRVSRTVLFQKGFVKRNYPRCVGVNYKWDLTNFSKIDFLYFCAYDTISAERCKTLVFKNHKITLLLLFMKHAVIYFIHGNFY